MMENLSKTSMEEKENFIEKMGILNIEENLKKINILGWGYFTIKKMVVSYIKVNFSQEDIMEMG